MKNSLFSALRRAAAGLAMLALSGSAMALSCPGGKVEQGGLCYNPPRSGYTCTAAACMQDCPSGYSPSAPGFCHYRGSTTYTEAPYITKKSSHPHRCLALYYDNCRANYRMDACGICSYKGAWDTTRNTYFREPGVSPDFSKAFTHIASTAQATYGSSIGQIKSGYDQTLATVNAAMDAVTLRLFQQAAKVAMSGDLGPALQKTIKAFRDSANAPDGNDLNDMKRILTLVASTKTLSADQIKDVGDTMIRLSSKFGMLCGPGWAPTTQKSNFPTNFANSSGGIYAGAGGAYVGGVDGSIGLVHNCQLDDGKMKFAVVANVGGSVGYAFIAGAGVGLQWSPGSVDQQSGGYVGLLGAATVVDGSITWSVAKGMRGAQNAIPGISAGTGVGAGVQASLTGGYSWILNTFSYTVPK
ncbi:MAG: hypothetical protein EOP35_12180 [Rubrivivax sp.]|nr:MAG: hypothetical protein EOP35_12180 [Rubrivivax sp.]